jgi:putative transposase
MKAFVDEHRNVYGVEPICKVLPIARSTYRTHAARRINPMLRSARAQHDERLICQVRRVWEENHQVYGVRKVWRQLNREGLTTYQFLITSQKGGKGRSFCRHRFR